MAAISFHFPFKGILNNGWPAQFQPDLSNIQIHFLLKPSHECSIYVDALYVLQTCCAVPHCRHFGFPCSFAHKKLNVQTEDSLKRQTFVITCNYYNDQFVDALYLKKGPNVNQ